MATNRYKYTLIDNSVVTAQRVAGSVGITISAARLRLKRSGDPRVIFAAPNKTTDHAATAKVYELSNGFRATVRELREFTGIKENTLRQRLKASNDYDFITRPLVFEDLDAKIYVFQDGKEVTVGALASARKCSHAAAYELLERMGLKTKRARKRYKLNDGRYVTAAYVMAATGLAHRTAKRRLQNSADPQYVLAPRGTRPDKEYRLTDGRHVTARYVSSATGVTFDGAKQRLNRSREPAVVFKPHYSERKRLVTVTRFIETEHGLSKMVETRRSAEVLS